MAEIKFLSGPLEGKRIELSNRNVTLGRSPETDIPLDDISASGNHAALRLESDRWQICDLGSSNGLQVNDKKVDSCWLASGDVISIGASRFVLLADVFQEDVSAIEASSEDLALVHKMKDHTEQIRLEVGKVIVGQREVLDQMLMCMIAGGHALVVGLPGMAKSLLVQTISQVIDLKYQRVQLTPDLMPTDIIGTDVLVSDQATDDKEIRFIPGPVFCNLLLADEINRTPPKTQAALLDAMQEKIVTAGTQCYALEEPFFVLATQNPVEQEGSYPLSEAQLARFMFNIMVDYPSPHEEEEILRVTTAGKRPDPKPVLSRNDIIQLQEIVRRVPVSEHIIKYVTRLVGATRPVSDDVPEVTREFVSTGAGPRAGQYIILAAKAAAVLDGRIQISYSDIRCAAPPVLRHRILTNSAAASAGMTSLDIVHKLLEEVAEQGAEANPADGKFKKLIVKGKTLKFEGQRPIRTGQGPKIQLQK